MPDEELSKRWPPKGETQHVNLEAQVKRMLNDWRASAFTENFIPQWLEIGDIDKVSRTQQVF